MAGESNDTIEFIVLLIPFIFINFSSGVISGITAEIAGVCMPLPVERTTVAA